MDFLDLLSGTPPGLGKPSLRLEFANNEQMFSFFKANPGAENFINQGKKKPTRPADFYNEVRNLLPATTDTEPPRAVETDPELIRVENLLKSGNPITREEADRFPDLVAKYRQTFEELGLQMIIKPIENSHISEFETDGSGVVMAPLSQIFTDHKNFQNRETDFSKDSVDRIVRSIRDGSFRWAIFDPITLWNDPKDNRFKILSGHSRTEAFRIASGEELQAEGRTFDRIPAKIFTGTLAEAKELARTSNNLSTRETDQERANYYRQKRIEGQSAKEQKDEAARLEGKNANFILNLSYLNPSGKAWDNLKLISQGTESENSRAMKEMADWIGEARRKFPDLTNGHENEIFDWLFSGAYHKLKTKREYLERLGMAISKATQFGVMDERLNIENRSGKSSNELEYEEEVANARKAYETAEKVLKDKRKEFITRGADPDKLDSYLVDYQAAVNNTLRKLNELVKLRDSVREGARNQMSLFGSIERNPLSFLDLLSGIPSAMGAITILEPDFSQNRQLGNMGFENEKVNFYSQVKLRKTRKKVPVPALRTKKDLIAFLTKYVYDKDDIGLREVCHAIFIDSQINIAGVLRIAEGGLDQVHIDTRLIFMALFSTGASRIIITHNHPSGSPEASPEDLRFTRVLGEQCKLMGVELTDHIVITEQDYFSFSENDLL